MVKSNDYIDPDVTFQHLIDGFVKMQKHPTEDLWLFNYTSKAQYESIWDDVTSRCRGLITDHHNIVARPFAKFFNWGELDRDMLPRGPIRVQDKVDGSLGILYQKPSTLELAIATRGSFTSEQALHATEVLRTRYEDFLPFNGVTYLFEILLPWNRIVVDYFGAPNAYVSQRPAQDDRGKHVHKAERMEIVPGLSDCKFSSGSSETQRDPRCQNQSVGEGESGKGESREARSVDADTGSRTGREEGSTLRGLQENVSTGCDGLRSRSGSEVVQRSAGENTKSPGRGDREVRTGVRKLSSGSHQKSSVDGELVLLDIIDNETGHSYIDQFVFRDTWPGPVVERFEYPSIEDVLTAPERPGKEGFVITYENGFRVKVKQEEYVRLHRLLTGVSSKTIWEILSTGGDFMELLDRVPDEYYLWVQETRSALLNRHAEIKQLVELAYKETSVQIPNYDQMVNDKDTEDIVFVELDDRERKKRFAALVKDHPLKGLLFFRYDNKDYDNAIWRMIKPTYSKPFWNQNEDDL